MSGRRIQIDRVCAVGVGLHESGKVVQNGGNVRFVRNKADH